MEGIAGETGCGFASTAGDLYSSSGMGGFVERVFLTEKQAPPKPVAKPAPRPAPCVDSDRDGVCDDADRCPNTPAGATVDARGCWALKGEVLFDFDSSVIKPKAYPLLDEVAKILDMNPGLKAIFEGHTDSVGAAAYNQRLPERRADAVMRYVLGRGIPAGQVSAVGYGEQRPAASNDTEQGRAMNRRVEITPDK